MIRSWKFTLIILAGYLCSCNGEVRPTAATQVGIMSPDGAGTPLPFGTYQAEIQLTAVWVQTLTSPQTATAQAPTPVSANFVTDFANRRGECPELSGFQVHTRLGFCISAPQLWIASNVDGGLAGTLNTTPGQSIALQPDWAADSTQCYLLVYVSTESSAGEHLELRYREYQMRTNLTELSNVALSSLGSLTLPGFTWRDSAGARGGVYAAMLSENRLLHISEGGLNCPLDQLLPTLETLRFN